MPAPAPCGRGLALSDRQLRAIAGLSFPAVACFGRPRCDRGACPVRSATVGPASGPVRRRLGYGKWLPEGSLPHRRRPPGGSVIAFALVLRRSSAIAPSISDGGAPGDPARAFAIPPRERSSVSVPQAVSEVHHACPEERTWWIFRYCREHRRRFESCEKHIDIRRLVRQSDRPSAPFDEQRLRLTGESFKQVIHKRPSGWWITRHKRWTESQWVVKRYGLPASGGGTQPRRSRWASRRRRSALSLMKPCASFWS